MLALHPPSAPDHATTTPTAHFLQAPHHSFDPMSSRVGKFLPTVTYLSISLPSPPCSSPMPDIPINQPVITTMLITNAPGFVEESTIHSSAPSTLLAHLAHDAQPRSPLTPPDHSVSYSPGSSPLWFNQNDRQIHAVASTSWSYMCNEETLPWTESVSEQACRLACSPCHECESMCIHDSVSDHHSFDPVCKHKSHRYHTCSSPSMQDLARSTKSFLGNCRTSALSFSKSCARFLK